MNLSFKYFPLNSSATPLNADIKDCIIAGWSGRNHDDIEHHIEELAAIGIRRPSAVPLFYRVAASQFNQSDTIQVVGDKTSGEAEAFVFATRGKTYVSLASDHTDRQLEAHSVALSKQICATPVARDAWDFESVADHWDALILKSWILEGGKEVLYQEGPLSQLRTATDLIERCFGPGNGLPDHNGMTCGTVVVQGGIRPSSQFRMELHDPVLKRSIRHEYKIEVLPEVA
ncbi:hypothetical protein CDEF62S_05946 [Castellaniella defragrans]